MGAVQTNGLPARHVVARRIADPAPSNGAPIAMADTSETCKIEQVQLRVLVEGSQEMRPISNGDLEPQIELSELAPLPKITRHANVIRRGRPILATVPDLDDGLGGATTLHVDVDDFADEPAVVDEPAPVVGVMITAPPSTTIHWVRSLVLGATIGLVLVAVMFTVLTLTA
ncbi:MAG: hypothetical protein ABI867_08635 [Kofleriaceae bacterium]